MTPRILLTTTTLALMATTAHADVTPSQVWDDFRGYMQGFGYVVQGTETSSGGVLTVNNARMTVTSPTDGGTVIIDMNTLRFADVGDGSVRIEFPPTIPITVDQTNEDGEQVDLTLSMRQSGLEMIVSGTTERLSYTYSAPTLGLDLTALSVDGTPVPRDNGSFGMEISNMTGTTQVAVGNLRRLTQSASLEGLTYSGTFSEPDNSSRGSISGAITALTFEGTNALPLQMTNNDMAALISAGFDLNSQLSHSGGTMTIEGSDNGRPTRIATTTQSGVLDIKVGAGGLTYATNSTGVTLDLTGADVPVPVTAAMQTAALNITAPVAAGDTPQPFALGLTLGGFTTSDMLWNMFDPGQVLPRDPATIALDMTGLAKLAINLMDPAATARAESAGTPAGELNALTINNLQISAAGADLTGNGDFTFDNTDTSTFDGFPRPTGGISLTLTGANALIDKLIQMGLVSQEDAMGARMMISMFAVPGTGPDTLNSRIEINAQGHILANGMRIQ